jgi:hypothetical protein
MKNGDSRELWMQIPKLILFNCESNYQTWNTLDNIVIESVNTWIMLLIFIAM